MCLHILSGYHIMIYFNMVRVEFISGGLFIMHYILQITPCGRLFPLHENADAVSFLR